MYFSILLKSVGSHLNFHWAEFCAERVIFSQNCAATILKAVQLFSVARKMSHHRAQNPAKWKTAFTTISNRNSVVSRRLWKPTLVILVSNLWSEQRGLHVIASL